MLDGYSLFSQIIYNWLRTNCVRNIAQVFQKTNSFKYSERGSRELGKVGLD